MSFGLINSNEDVDLIKKQTNSFFIVSVDLFRIILL